MGMTSIKFETSTQRTMPLESLWGAVWGQVRSAARGTTNRQIISALQMQIMHKVWFEVRDPIDIKVNSLIWLELGDQP